MSVDWFSNWQDVARVFAVGSAAYLTIVLLLRSSGKRTLTQLNAFDFIVTVALGSILGSVILNESVSFTEGVTALLVLLGWQYLLSWLSSRIGWVQKLLASEPRLLLHDGQLLPKALRAERITEEQLLQAGRMKGAERLGDVASMVMETNGTISVLMKRPAAGKD